MSVNSNVAQKIRKLIPLGTLSLTRFNAICSKIQLLELQAGEFLFNKGDIESELVYLLSGEVSLQALGMQIENINAESYSARFAIGHQLPRKIDALALTPVQIIRVNPNYLTGSDAEQEVIDAMEKVDGDADDWMTALLKSPVFKRLPPANLQKILTGLQEITVAKDTVIIRQGDEGEYYHLIKQGQCVLSRKPNPSAREIILAQLRAGDMFGEDSLLSEQPISSSVKALTPVTLLRLDKQQFLDLIKTPSLVYIQAADLDAEIKAGAQIIDVRTQEVYDSWHVQNSICCPFFSLRMQLQLKIFDRTRPVIVVCEDGKLSQAAAFLLLRYKVAVKILRKGLAGLANVESTVWRFIEGEVDAVVDSLPFVELPRGDADISDVRQENAYLKAELHTLKQQLDAILHEKEDAEKNYRVLFKQTEKLKELLLKYHPQQNSGD